MIQLIKDRKDSTGKHIILWLSRHEPTKEQIIALEKRYASSENEILQYSNSVKNAKEVNEIMEDLFCNVIVAVLPISILAELVNTYKIKVIRSVMNRREENYIPRDEKGRAMSTSSRTVFDFVRFEIVEKIVIETSEF